MKHIFHSGAGARKRLSDRIELRSELFQISSLRATWGRGVCVCYIYRRSILGDLSPMGWAQGKKYLMELSFGASGSRFLLSVPRDGGRCVLYIQRVDFREFVTRGLAQGKNHMTELSFGASGSRFSSLRATWGRDVCYIYTYIEGRFEEICHS